MATPEVSKRCNRSRRGGRPTISPGSQLGSPWERAIRRPKSGTSTCSSESLQLRVLASPERINARASSRHRPVSYPYVMRALHFVRQLAARGAKVAQVADYVGVSRTTLETHE